MSDAAVCVPVQEIWAYILLTPVLCDQKIICFHCFFNNKFNPWCIIAVNDLTIVFAVKYQKFSSVFFIFAVDLLFGLISWQMYLTYFSPEMLKIQLTVKYLCKWSESCSRSKISKIQPFEIYLYSWSDMQLRHWFLDNNNSAHSSSFSRMP